MSRLSFHQRLHKLGFASYEAYLLSDQWASKRKAYIDLHGWDCKICGKVARHLHHQTYARVGRERISDLVSLCAPCHELVHARPDGNLWVDTTRPKQHNRNTKEPAGAKSPRQKKESVPPELQQRVLVEVQRQNKAITRARLAYLCIQKESEVQRCLKRLRAMRLVTESKDGWIATK